MVPKGTAARPCLGPVPGAVPLQTDWIRRLQICGKELKRVFFTEFYADVEPPDDGSTTSRQIIASKTTCALDVQILTCSQPSEQCREILRKYQLQDRLKGQRPGQSECYLLVWDARWAMEWTERDMTAGTPNPFLISKSSPTVDFLAEMTPVWPPAPGARVSGSDRRCPAGIALVHYDAKRNGPFHDNDDTVQRPTPGQHYYRVDRATRKAQFNKVNATIREFFSAGCDRAALRGTALPPIAWALVFRHEDCDNKARALAVPAQGAAADLLLAQASETLERTIDDPDQPGADQRAAQQAEDSPGIVFQRLLPSPKEEHLERTCYLRHANTAQRRCVLATQNSLLTLCHGPPGTGETKVAACLADAYMSCLAPGWGVGCLGCTGGSMGTLAEQSGKNLNPASNDLFPRLAARLAHEDKVKGSVAKKITPIAEYAKMHNIAVGEVTTGHANWFHKFRAEVATEAKLILATREAGPDLWDKKSLICLLDKAGQTFEPMAIMSLIHAVRCGARTVLFGDERQLRPTADGNEAVQAACRLVA
ncbi:unnamed protein product, partial [Prorocentrum cordatum]